MTKAWLFIQTPLGQVVLLIACVVALVLVVTWPEFKQWIFKTIGHTPQPKPLPLDERVRLIEAERLPEVAQRAATLIDSKLSGYRRKLEEVDSNVTALENDHASVHQWINAADAHNQNVSDRLDGLTTKLDGSISWQERMRIPERFGELTSDLRDLKASAGVAVDALRKRAAKADKAIELIPSYFRRQEDFAELKTLLGGIILDFHFIRQACPSSAPARLPFSDWRTTTIPATNDRIWLFAESVAQRLERYVEIAQASAIRWGRDVFGGDIFRVVPRWKYTSVTDISGEAFMTMLQTHFAELRNMESDYAAIWSKTVEESATIS